jgi:hypothetical protein
MMTAQEERMLNIRRASLMVALLIPATGAAQTITTVEQEPPAPTDSAQPQLSVTRDGRVVLSWLEAAPQNSRRFRVAFGSVRGSGSTSIQWSAPMTITEGERVLANWADVPSVVALPDGTLVAHWLQTNGPGKRGYDVMLRTSSDGGRSWSDPVTPHEDRSETFHGFVSIVPWPDGGIGVVWTDGGVSVKQSGGNGQEVTKADGALRARVYRAPTPGVKTPSTAAAREMLVDGRVCDCCAPAAAGTNRGVIVAYRDRSASEVRDISVTRFENGVWTEGAPVHADNWQINGCPVNGPAISAIGSRVALAWFAAPNNAAHVSVALSSNAGSTFGKATRIDDGLPLGRVDVEQLPDGSALVAWVESTPDKNAELRVRRVSADGARGDAIAVARMSSERTKSGQPRMVRAGDRVVFAWVAVNDDKTTEVRVAAGTLVGDEGLRRK